MQDSTRAASELGGRSLESLGRHGREALTLVDQMPDYASGDGPHPIGSWPVAPGPSRWNGLGLRQERLLKNLEGMTDLLSCRTIPDFVSLQSSLVRGNVERMLENSQRLAQLTAQVAQEATRTSRYNPSTISALAKDLS